MSINENSKRSGNSYSKRGLKRMKICFGSTEVKFAVNPEDYTQSEPNRVTLTQTKGGAWIDAWGAGIVEITIKGTTGVKGTGKSIDTGYNRWKTLRNLFRKVYESIADGEEVKQLIKFYNFTDNEFFYCYPMQNGIELYRSKSRPHLYQYTINLWGVRRIGQPEISTGVIGNPNKSKSSGAKTTTSTSSVVKASGGTTYTMGNIPIDSEVAIFTTTSTRTKSLDELKEDCLEYYTKLEPIIGGKAGKISPATGFQCTQGITMQSSGTVSNVNSFNGLSLSDKQDLLLGEVKYNSKVSVETYKLYMKIKEYSPAVLSTSYSLVVGITPQERVMQAISSSTAYDSTIYDLIVQYQPKSIITKSEINHLKLILLESMMVYRELYSLYQQSETLTTNITLSSVDILINNIRAMIMYFALKSTENNINQRQDISNELRTLEKIMTQVQTDVIMYL